MDNKLRIVFFGTPEFSVPALQSLIEANFDVVAAITRPDKPVGRKQTLTPPPVKIIAQKNNVKVFQPIKIDEELIQQVKELNPNLFVIVAYGKILPQKLLDIPEHGSFNIHPSLLPKYRGPSPLQATLLSDDKETGVCLMLIDEEMDHGPILASYKALVTSNKNYESLGNELFELGAQHLPEIIQKHIDGEIKPQEQDHEQATYCKFVKKEHGLIDWQQSAEYIEKMTRAYYPWPSAYAKLKIKNEELKTKEDISFKIIRAHVSNIKSELEPGTVFTHSTSSGQKTLAVACGDKTALLIEELQPANKKKMTSAEFLRGHKIN